MYLKTYLRALLSAIHEYFELFGKIQAYTGAGLAIIAVFFSISFPDYASKLKPYLPQLIILLTFIVLFLSGYKAWLKLYNKNIKEQVIKIVNIDSQIMQSTSVMGVKLKEINIGLAYTIYNNTDTIIRIIGLNQKEIFKKIGTLNFPNHGDMQPTLPLILKPKSSIDFVTFTYFHLENLNYEEQINFLSNIKGIKGKTNFTVTSVNGREEIEVITNLDAKEFLSNLLNNQFRLNTSPIEKALRKFDN